MAELALSSIGKTPPAALVNMPAAQADPQAAHQPGLPLFRQYPTLANELPHAALGQFPTPVEHLAELGNELGLPQLFIKRDDLSGGAYGGNKVRKLEFLFGAALRVGAREVITMGFAGSNHALATAIYARQLGLRCTLLLLPQVNAHYVRHNLLADLHADAELLPCRNFATLSLWLSYLCLRGKIRDGQFPKFIPPGGSCPLGVIGYVNAALELRDQIAAGLLPEPDLIYVPLGSMGTAAGLSLGLRAAGLHAKVVAVRVIGKKLANQRKLILLLRKTVALLRRLDPAFPDVSFSDEALSIRDECFGGGYARFTSEGARATAMMKSKAAITLNGAYSAKAVAAIVRDAERGDLRGKTVLFWNTYNSRSLAPRINGSMDYHQLPNPLQRYFREDVQPLDKE